MAKEWIDLRGRAPDGINQQGVLSGPEIARLARASADDDATDGKISFLPHVKITPFEAARAGPNSYDVSLGRSVRMYGSGSWLQHRHDLPAPIIMCNHTPEFLDPRKNNDTTSIDLPDDGAVFLPGRLYLGSTVERTQCSGVVPWLDGRSSVGRLGVQVHATAGRGDDGFGEAVAGGCAWTLEITVTHPVILWPGMVIGQLTFMTLVGERKPYAGRYSTQPAEPVASRFWQNKETT